MSHVHSEAGPSTYMNLSHALAPLAPDTASGHTMGSVATEVEQPTGPHVFTEAQIEEWREQDRYLPIANVGRIMKNILPDNAKIAKEAKECVQECVSEFISFLSSEAADKVLTDKRKTINGEDVIYSMTQLGFDNYSEACKVYLTKYRFWLNEQQARNNSRHPSRANSTDPPLDGDTGELSPSSSILDHDMEADEDELLSEDEPVRFQTGNGKKGNAIGAGAGAGKAKAKKGTGSKAGQAKASTEEGRQAGKKRKSNGPGYGDGGTGGKKRKGGASAKAAGT